MIDMIKVFFLTALLAVSIAISTQAQGVIDAYLTHRVTLNQADQDIVTYVKPVRLKHLQAAQQYHWFAKGQISSTQGGYSGKLLNGPNQAFYANKSLKESGHFAAGLKVGSWKSWTDSGLLREDYTWSAGKKAGSYVLYDSLGKVAEKGTYRRDLLHGKQYQCIAEVRTVRYYKNGKMTEPKKLRMPAFLKKIFKKKEKAAAQ